jgi:hypothetical protein
MRSNPTAPERYGVAHRRLRQRIDAEVELGLKWCVECGRWIAPGSAWHVAHDDRTGGYAGPAHARCNVGERNSRTTYALSRDARGPGSPTWPDEVSPAAGSATETTRPRGGPGRLGVSP